MGAIWLGSLPQVLRDAGLDVDVYPGWETRSRGSGGYDAVWAVQVHHTGSFASPANDMAYMWLNAPDEPIGALYLARDGRWTVGAAGATNTSGRGGPLRTSKGTIPLDAANRYVISVEAANRGDGEQWPDAQLWSYIVGVNAIARAYGISTTGPGDVHAHFEWTTRKVDPAGNSWYASGRNKWDMDKFRSDVNSATPATTNALVYAGVDSNGTNYNKNEWVIPGGGGGLVLQSDMSLRTASLRNGNVTVGAHNSYSRPLTRDSFTVPFEVSGEIFLHGRMDGPFRTFGENLLVQSTDRWTWGVNFQPVFVDEDNNIVTGFSPLTTRFTASGQIGGKYGIPRVERFTAAIDHDAQFGAWHRWRMVVPAVGTHEVYLDDRLMYRVVEADPPAAWWSRPLRAGLRLDWYDYSLRNLKTPATPQPPAPPAPPAPPIITSKDTDMLIIDLYPNTPKWTAMQIAGNKLTHLVNGHHVGVLSRGGVGRVPLGTAQTSAKAELQGILLSLETTNPSPFAPGKPAADADLHRLWVERAEA